MAGKFIWTEDYSVGIELIDGQHKHFFDIANKTIDLTETAGLTREILLPHLDQLGNYAFYHLGTEEEYFQKFSYPDAASHIEAHNQYRARINNYYVVLRGEGGDIKELAREMAEFTNDWLRAHIIVMDKKYSQIFREHGLK